MRSGMLCLLLTGLLAPPLAHADDPTQKSPLAANAAIQYWQAFAQLQSLDQDQQKLLEQWNTVPLDDPAVAKVLAAGQSSLLYLHRGAKLPQCDWGLDYGDGVSLLLPHLAKARDLARLAALHGRQEFERKNGPAARDDATAIMTLARHVGRDPIMIAILVRYNIEGLAIDLVAPYATDIKAPHAEVVRMFEALPPAANVLSSIDVEKRYFAAWIAKKLREEEARQPGAGLTLWKNFLEGAEVPESVRKLAAVPEAIQLTEELLPVYDELAKFVARPRDQFETQYPVFRERAKAANPLAGVILPAVDSLLAKERRSEARLAMLMAAIAVGQGGADKLKDCPDPFGDGAFAYRPLDKGFELQSKLTFEGQPVTLKAGQAARK
jgi:hypothetical protein